MRQQLEADLPGLSDRWPGLVPPVIDQMTYGEVIAYIRHAKNSPPPARMLYTSEG